MPSSSDPLLPSGDAPALDVLVVGAGPVGLLAAIELASRGCSVRIIDDHEQPLIQTKASGIHARSMEVLPTPVVEQILRTSLHVKRARLTETDGASSEVIANFDMEPMATYHGMRSQEQWRTEGVLTEHLQTLPDHLRVGRTMQVERPYELLSLSEVADGVECQVRNKQTGVAERVTAKFLLGCDGGRSTVRKQLGFTFEGETTAEYFFALHAGLENYTGDGSCVDLFFSKGEDPLAPGFAFAMPMPDGGFLVTADLDDQQQKNWKTSELDRFGQAVLRQPTPEEVCAVLSHRGCGPQLSVKPGSVKWVAHFRVSSRQSSHYGKGRVYLAGDACHCHSPLGGQGMNMGFQDAKNIAWKLAFAAKGVMALATLESYEQERHGVDQKICAAIETGQKVVSNRNPFVFFLRGRGQRLAPVLLSFTSAPLSYTSQQAWTYAAGSLSMEHWERPVPSFASLCPAGGYRRRQNIFRWAGCRVRAGDRVPEVAIGYSTLQQVLKRSRGWSLLLFEGSEFDNEEMRCLVSGAEVLSFNALQALGQSLKSAPDATGFVGGIDEVLVFQKRDRAHREFGVRGQCLFLVRPDMHVGLRSEPVRVGVVHRYFKQQCGHFDVPEHSAPASATRFDPLPICVWTILFFVFMSCWVSTGCESLVLKSGLVLSVIMLGILWLQTRPPRF
ncbi:unnamed protein product [Polarella glacialis]|uniref:FAD-binding domain-containing protein n=1 Tax=Polarella glacialis TaxID=89957 RepID=A0A813DQP9_POLGL|nr:unnamed protein product [Polarella glacialis]CAE8645691.1 unnamed protein product [Polarella glacialis]